MDTPDTDLARELRRLREERGLSLRAWADAIGLPLATLSCIESGRDIDWMSVRRLLRQLPELSPAALLGPAADGPRPANARSWDAWTELLGFRSSRVTVTLDESGRITVEVEGLRRSRGTLRDRGRRIATLGAVLVGPPELAYELEETESLPLGQPLRFETEDAIHELEVPRDPDREGLSYRRRTRRGHVDAFPHGLGEGPFEDGATYWLDHPTELLVLRTPATLGLVAPWAWPPSLAPTAAAALALWRRLHPRAPTALTSEGGRQELQVERPTPGLAFGLAPLPSGLAQGSSETPAPSPARVRPLERCEPGPVLHRARCAEGLSQRELAERVGCSPATINRLEAGSEPRLSLVRACLDALPSACAFELLPLPKGPPTPEEIWAEQRALFGVESREEQRRIDIDAQGGAEIEARSVGIAWDEVHGEELGLRFGTARTPAVATDWELEAVNSRPRS